MPRPRVAVKRLLLGRPGARGERADQLLPRWLALGVLASVPLSSVAYATQELLVVLGGAGAAGLRLAVPVSLAVAVLTGVVVATQRDIMRAYPSGGAAYLAAREQLGDSAGLATGAALLVGSVATVAVSVAAAAAALIAAMPALAPQRLTLALALLALVVLVHLRGRDAGMFAALPTVAFLAVLVVLLLAGLLTCVLAGCPQARGAGPGAATAALTPLLVLQAAAIGTVVLTGVELVPNAVATFRFPQALHAAWAVTVIGGLTAVAFVGVSLLAAAIGVAPAADTTRTVTADIAVSLGGQGAALWVTQVATAAVLLLAAHTALANFPRLASALACDRWLPRQLMAQGDRLAFSNSIGLLTLAAAVLLAAFRARVGGLLPLYLAGVAFGLMMAHGAMMRHWLRARTPDRRARAGLAALAAAAIGLVFVVSLTLGRGAWVAAVAVPLLGWGMLRVSRHYQAVQAALQAADAGAQVAGPAPGHHAVILLDRVDEAAARALSYMQACNVAGIRALAVPLPGTDVERRWAELAPDVPCEVLQPANSRGVVDALVANLRQAAGEHPEAFTSAVVPETMSYDWWDQLREHRLALRLKARLLRETALVVTDLTSPVGGPGPYTVEEPREHHVLVLVSAVNRATLRALRYAAGLRPTTLQALSVNLDASRSDTVLQGWMDQGLDTPLELVDSPFRSLTDTLRATVRQFSPDGRDTIVTCVLPELVVPRWWHRPLHNQTAVLIKAALLFERGVVTTSVPYAVSAEELDALASRAAG